MRTSDQAKQHRHRKQEEIFTRLGVTRAAEKMGMTFDKAKNHKRSQLIGDSELKALCEAEGRSYLAESLRFTPFLENSEELAHAIDQLHHVFGSDDLVVMTILLMQEKLSQEGSMPLLRQTRDFLMNSSRPAPRGMSKQAEKMAHILADHLQKLLKG